jgi:predicted nucleotidyltransferase
MAPRLVLGLAGAVAVAYGVMAAASLLDFRGIAVSRRSRPAKLTQKRAFSPLREPSPG